MTLSIFCLSDGTLKIGDTALPVHKLILSMRSPVFAAMFASKMSEAKNGEVVIDDLELSVAKEMIRFDLRQSVRADPLNHRDISASCTRTSARSTAN
jgi:hypothetical protein